MIKVYYEKDIIDKLAALISYGIDNGYSYKSIEEHIVSSSFINELEHNQYNINLSIERVVEETYKIKLIHDANISFSSLFLAESYYKLFLSINRSFEYLFLYWPLSNFVRKYDIYHEMDFSNLKNDFVKKVNETTLLKMLCKKKGFKLTDVALLLGINSHSLSKYYRSDSFLNGASLDTIHRLSLLFNVKENIFSSSLVFPDSYIYLFDESNEMLRQCLGLYYLSYYVREINESDYFYSEKEKCFISKKNNQSLLSICVDLRDININLINKLVDKNTDLVIFPIGYFGQEEVFELFKKINSHSTLVVTQENVYLLNKGIKKEITDVIYKFLWMRAKEKVTTLSSR